MSVSPHPDFAYGTVRIRRPPERLFTTVIVRSATPRSAGGGRRRPRSGPPRRSGRRGVVASPIRSGQDAGHGGGRAGSLSIGRDGQQPLAAVLQAGRRHHHQHPTEVRHDLATDDLRAPRLPAHDVRPIARSHLAVARHADPCHRRRDRRSRRSTASTLHQDPHPARRVALRRGGHLHLRRTGSPRRRHLVGALPGQHQITKPSSRLAIAPSGTTTWPRSTPSGTRRPPSRSHASCTGSMRRPAKWRT